LKIAVIVFPGSNCDHDILHTYNNLLGHQAYPVWHKDKELNTPDLVVIPGGFSFGDYLRTGSLARLSPIMSEVEKFAGSGGAVLGICNGFQVLCEAGLLPGALLQNKRMKFLSRFVNVRVENNKTPFTGHFKAGDVFTCPISHFDGNYYADKQTIQQLEEENRIIFRYCDSAGLVEPENMDSNPNGSINAIAGICNEKRNVVGMMPHPERAAERLIGREGEASGLSVFSSLTGTSLTGNAA